MTRRSSKIQNQEEMTAKKPVRKAGRPKKEEVLQNKKADIKVKVTKTATRRESFVRSQEDDKAAILEEIKSSHAKEKADKAKRAAENQSSRRLNSLAIYEREERKKILIMWAGVGVFMFLIAGFWIYDTKKIFEESRLEPSANADFSFDKLTESVKDVSGRIDELRQELAKASSTLATTTIDQSLATSTTTSTNLTDLASTTASSTYFVVGVTEAEMVSTSTVPKPELIVKELQEKLMSSTTEDGTVKGVFEERDIINELKNKLEK
ncbi:hypothetical protein L6270_01615 [Candidatus Parcubacteria bacterium]|nr:hypothetical protein [Patescibacteria group bacterium]MBU4309838.1 hypothetical protein [Patescibacteria group bacterium]MBU4431989.1 hypothetical protein [Patescibacteria group bacterium]MBU4578177.1 hypothetical protein [Patescibacteria group bacterium]MCG2696714.1 hypothetical protein [Candidatus Parcubacteria bacterium]